MNPSLVRDIEDVVQAPATRATLKAGKPLLVAASMLSAAAPHAMTATTVVGVVGQDDVGAVRALVRDLSEEYGLQATVKLQVGSYSVRFSRRCG